MSLFQRFRTPFTTGADEDPAIFGNRPHAIGELLRDRREELELDLDSIGETLRIKPVYLAALEQGRAQDLPGAAYAIGFIRAYAAYLGFDAERVLEHYKAESAEVHAWPDLTLPVPLGARSLPGGPILLVGLILALCGYGTWYYLSTGERNRPERVVAVPAELRPPQRAAAATATAGDVGGNSASRFGSGLATLGDPVPAHDGTAAAPPAPGMVASPAAAAPPSPSLPKPGSAGATSVPGPAAAPPVASSPPKASGGAAVPIAIAPVRAAAPASEAAVAGADNQASGRIEIRALADCWIQVRAADQSIVFSRVLKAGETYNVPRAGLFLRTGNAGALAVTVEGKPAPAIGGIGTLRRNVALDPEALLAGTAVHG